RRLTQKFECFGRIAQILDELGDGEVSQKREKEIREIIEEERQNGRISNALAVSKLLYERTSSTYSFKSYIKSLFQAQKYERVVSLCSDSISQSKELVAYVKKSQAYLEVLKLFYHNCVQNVTPPLGKISSGKSVYFLHSSLPYLTGGYATRAHGLANALI